MIVYIIIINRETNYKTVTLSVLWLWCYIEWGFFMEVSWMYIYWYACTYRPVAVVGTSLFYLICIFNSVIFYFVLLKFYFIVFKLRDKKKDSYKANCKIVCIFNWKWHANNFQSDQPRCFTCRMPSRIFHAKLYFYLSLPQLRCWLSVGMSLWDWKLQSYYRMSKFK